MKSLNQFIDYFESLNSLDFDQRQKTEGGNRFNPLFIKFWHINIPQGIEESFHNSQLLSHDRENILEKVEDWTIEKLNDVMKAYPEALILFKVAKRWIDSESNTPTVQFLFNNLYERIL